MRACLLARAAGSTCLVAALLLSTTACLGTKRPRGVLLVSIDTMRADRLGCYGRSAADTPVIDSLAARGARFADASTAVPLTLPSHATLLTGREPLRHSVRDNGLFALPANVPTLAESLSAAGFHTAASVASSVLSTRYGLGRGFEAYFQVPFATGASTTFAPGERPATAVNADALRWLDGVRDAPFFLWAHYIEPHAPYEPPEPEASRHRDDPYQGEIAAADRCLGELLQGLKARGRLDDTLVIVVSDHGEALGEHGEATHGLFLYQATVHVPFVAAGPGVRAGRVIAQPVGLVDVAATIRDAAGLPEAAGDDGTSLWPALSHGAPLAADRALYMESFTPRFDYGLHEIRAARQGARKYVACPRPELYDLGTDPSEATNLLPAAAQSAAPLASWLSDHVQRAAVTAAKPSDVAPSRAETESLRSLGYVQGAFPASGPSDLPDAKDGLAQVNALSRAMDLVATRKGHDAVALLQPLTKEHPEFFQGRLTLVSALLADGRPDEAAAEARALASDAEKRPEGTRLAAQAHVLLAQLASSDGRLADAVTEWQAAFKAPQPAEASLELAQLLDQLGRTYEAKAILQTSIARGDALPQSVDLLKSLGP